MKHLSIYEDIATRELTCDLSTSNFAIAQCSEIPVSMVRPSTRLPDRHVKCKSGNSFPLECINSALLVLTMAEASQEVCETMRKYRHNFFIHLKCTRTKRKPIYRNQKVFRTKLKRMEIFSRTFNWIEIAHFRIANDVLYSNFGMFCWCERFAFTHLTILTHYKVWTTRSSHVSFWSNSNNKSRSVKLLRQIGIYVGENFYFSLLRALYRKWRLQTPKIFRLRYWRVHGCILH